MASSVHDFAVSFKDFERSPEKNFIRAEYANKLSELHQKIYGEPTTLFGCEGFYLRSIRRNCVNKTFPQFLQLTNQVVEKEKALYEAIISGKSPKTPYQDFWRSYKEFCSLYHQSFIEKNPNGPYAIWYKNQKSEQESKNQPHLPNEIEMQVFNRSSVSSLA